jgi:hypothetical protein
VLWSPLRSLSLTVVTPVRVYRIPVKDIGSPFET